MKVTFEFREKKHKFQISKAIKHITIKIFEASVIRVNKTKDFLSL